MKTIIEMAREAGLHLYVNDLTEEPYARVVERFAALVRADERKENAKVCEDVHAGKYDALEFWREGVAYTCAAAIRARGQA